MTETSAGTIVQAEITPELDSSEVLSKIAGKEGAAIFWSGSSAENPDYSLTFYGDELSADDDSNFAFDPTVDVSELGTGDVANIMKQAKDGLVLDFAYKGDFPSEASVYVKVDSEFSDGTQVNLYEYDEDAKAFSKVDASTAASLGGDSDSDESDEGDATDGFTVSDDYVSFKVLSGGTYALSTDDLASYEVSETNTPRAVRDDRNEREAEDEQAIETLTPYIAAGVVAAVVIVAVIAAVVVVRKRKNAAQSAAGQAEEDAALGAEETGNDEAPDGGARNEPELDKESNESGSDEESTSDNAGERGSADAAASQEIEEPKTEGDGSKKDSAND